MRRKRDATIVVNQMEFDLFSIHAALMVWFSGRESGEEAWTHIRDIINGAACEPELLDDTEERRASK